MFELGLWCGTCPALFQRLSEPEAADLKAANELLATGMQTIEPDVLKTYGQVLPRSLYTALLLDLTPELVTPGSANDYFSHEQVATWGVDPVVGSPEDPATPYYRTFETTVGPDQHLYEFVVPMVPPRWNDPARTADYAERSGHVPATAVAYSLLDVVQPVSVEGDDHYEHWVLTHFLLDGHHKVQAAAASGRPVRLLSLVDERVSMASPDDVAILLRARSAPRRSRT